MVGIKKQQKSWVFILAFFLLIVGGILYFVYPKGMTVEFKGIYQAQEGDMDVVIFPEEPGVCYFIQGAEKVIRGHYKKTGDNAYTISGNNKEESVIVKGLSFSFGEYTFKKVSDTPMLPSFTGGT